MAPITPSPEQTASYLVSGTGVLLLTQDQRRARRLSVVTEKVALAPRVEYLNLRTPEPNGFWGYIQIVQRDFIQETIQLEYRRQVLLTRDNPELEPIEQLRCLIKDSTLTLFDLIGAAFLAAGGDAEEIGQQRAQYLLRVGQTRLIPTAPETGLYYEIEPDRAARITLIWQGYLEPCDNPGGIQYLQPPRAPEKGESGGGGDGGGGTRPNEPPPEDLSSDPGSDNSTPPDGEPDIPTVDEPFVPPPRGAYRVTINVVNFQGGSAPCVPVAGGPLQFVYDVNPGPALVQKTFPSGGGYVWQIFDADANFVSNIVGSSARADCEAEATVVSQVRTDV
jgi:hypothetical protein